MGKSIGLIYTTIQNLGLKLKSLKKFILVALNRFFIFLFLINVVILNVLFINES